MAMLLCMICKHGSPDPKEVPAAAIGRATQGSVGSVGDRCTGKGGNETRRITLQQSQRLSRHYIGGYILGKAVWLQQQGSFLKKYPGPKGSHVAEVTSSSNWSCQKCRQRWRQVREGMKHGA